MHPAADVIPKAKRFYKSRVLSLSDDTLHLFLPMASIRKL